MGAPPARCRERDCAAQIIMAKRSDTGRWAPFDAEPADREGETTGWFQIVRSEGMWVALRFEDAVEIQAKADASSEQMAITKLDALDVWHVTHFATCKNPGRFRRD